LSSKGWKTSFFEASFCTLEDAVSWILSAYEIVEAVHKGKSWAIWKL
jgi:hypothetical protein